MYKTERLLSQFEEELWQCVEKVKNDADGYFSTNDIQRHYRNNFRFEKIPKIKAIRNALNKFCKDGALEKSMRGEKVTYPYVSPLYARYKLKTP